MKNLEDQTHIGIFKRILIFLKIMLLSLLFVSAFLGVIMLGHLGPWMIHQNYYPPHLTWDGSGPMSSTITVNFKTSPAICAVEYREVYSQDPISLGPPQYVNETEAHEFHKITLSGLKPNTLYQYRILEITNDLKTSVREDLMKEYIFKTAPEEYINNGSQLAEFSYKFIVMGDNRPNFFGTGQTDEINRAILNERDISFVINTGDLVLMGGGPKFWWRRYFMQNSYMRQILTLPTKGNHENFGIEDGTFNNTPYEENHAFPNNQNWYSYNYSNIHFICLETTDYKEGAMGDDRNAQMHEWLRNDLSRINTSEQIKFVVLYMHYPLDTMLGGNDINHDTWERIAGVEFKNAHVLPDIIFTGHVHDYERIWINFGDVDGDNTDDYTWNIITGGGGAELAPARWGTVEGNYKRVELVHHYCLVEANATALKIYAKYADGTVFDELTIEKE